MFDNLIEIGLKPSEYPHGSNISTKAQGALSAKQRNALLTAVPAYLAFYNLSKAYENQSANLQNLLSAYDGYSNLLLDRNVNCFSHQSDFVSSLLPELLCVLFRRVVGDLRLGAIIAVTSQKDIVIECNFDCASGGRIIEKRKRMDVAIIAPGTLKFRDTEVEFGIPAVCLEVKTNIDKNMLSGIESSVETLKRTFPRAKYYTVGEFSDFQIDSQNYASTAIDEILIVRRQKRSEVRRSPGSRNPIAFDLIKDFIKEIEGHLRQTMKANTTLASRLPSGRLI